MCSGNLGTRSILIILKVPLRRFPRYNYKDGGSPYLAVKVLMLFAYYLKIKHAYYYPYYYAYYYACHFFPSGKKITSLSKMASKQLSLFTTRWSHYTFIAHDGDSHQPLHQLCVYRFVLAMSSHACLALLWFDGYRSTSLVVDCFARWLISWLIY